MGIRRRKQLFRLGMAFAMVALCAGALVSLSIARAGGSAGVGADPVASGRVVLTPQPGELLREYPLTVRVRVHDDLGELRAWLNGRAIGPDFGLTWKGVRSAEVSISHGLRQGHNALRVWVRRRDGRWLKRTVRFELIPPGPLAGAGRDVRVVVGKRYRLRGVVSSGRGATAASAPAGRWQLAAGPRRSALGKPRPGGTRVPVFSASRSAAPSFKPDVPGPYTFRFTSHAASRPGLAFTAGGPTSTSDTVTVSAVPATPLVPIQTIAYPDVHLGVISVGGDNYPASNGYRMLQPGEGLLQVVVLDRKTLGLVSNTTYTCTPGSADDDPCLAQIGGDLAKLDDTKLVIAVSQPGFKHPSRLGAVLGKIGFPNLRWTSNAFNNAAGGTLSVIGVPGLPPGQADFSFVPDGQAGDGNMDGYLTPDQFSEFTWLPKERPEFDTRTTGSNADQNVIKVGQQTYPGGRTGYGGFQVTVLDGRTLQQRQNQFFATHGSAGPAFSTQQVQAMTSLLKDQTKVRPGDLVFIADVDLATDRALDPAVAPAPLRDLAAAIASVGGTMNTFNRSGIQDRSHYSLIGWGGAGEGNGVETSGLKDPNPGDARLRGALTRGHDSLFKPQTESALTQPPEALAQLILQSPIYSWPLDGDAGAQKAIAYIGGQLSPKQGDNPRLNYQNLSQADAVGLAGQVNGMKDPADAPTFTDFSQKNFEDARGELVKELTWVGSVRSYMTKLSSPFDYSETALQAKFDTITNPIVSSLKPPDQKYTMQALDILGGVVQIVGAAVTAGGSEVAAIATEVASVVYEVGLEYFTQSQEGADVDSVTGTTAELKYELVKRLLAAKASLDKLGNILVSDYAKLQTAGTLGGCAPTAANCPAEWQFPNDSATVASAAVSRSLEGAFDQALVGLAFPTYVLGPRRVHQKPGTNQVTVDARDYPCELFGDFEPFSGEPGNGQVALLQELPDKYDVLALGNVTNLTSTNSDPNTPPHGILDRMFGAISSSSDPEKGGLGIYAPDFMRKHIVGDYSIAANNAVSSLHCGIFPW